MNIYSEIAPLRKVIVHRPGPEVERMTPETAKISLYNDIIPVEEVQKEHDGLVALLSRFTTVVEISEVIAEALETLESRIRVTETLFPDNGLHRRILQELWGSCDGTTAASHVVEGLPMPHTRLETVINGPEYLLPPLPNLYFTRDIGFVVGRNAFAGNMAHSVRTNESKLASLAFAALSGSALPPARVPGNARIEGGDVLVFSPKLLVIGVGERTAAASVDSLIGSLLENGTEEITVLAVLLPEGRATIHLDMIATLVDHHTLLAYTPFIAGQRPVQVFRIHAVQGRDWDVHEETDLVSALGNCRYPVDLIPCGGSNRQQQEREQWFSACNSLALAPGKIVVYDTNPGTLDQLAKAGFNIVDTGSSTSGLSAMDEATADRMVFAVRGTELARGGGGPRCMTLPVERMETE